MKRKIASALLVCLLAAGMILPVSAEDAADPAASLMVTINNSRDEASKPALTRDEGLDKIAQAYADILCEADKDFRKNTNFKTLPNGDKVISLASKYGVAVSGFSYSAFLDKNVDPAKTNEYHSKVVMGDFTRVGIACSTGADGSYATVIIYDKTAVAAIHGE